MDDARLSHKAPARQTERVTEPTQLTEVRGRRLFRGLLQITRAGAIRDVMAGFTLAAMNVPHSLGYTRIAGTPVVTGLYTLLLPLLAFATFGSSR
jgi:MFS superfamily sulfate permease-like transporter